MKNYKTLLVGLLLIVIPSGSVSARLQPQSQEAKQQDKEAKELVDAIRRGGFREAARLKGRYVARMDPTWDWSNFDLESLTARSAAVLIGEATDSSPQLSRDGDVLSTEYQIAVSEPIKGSFRQGNTIQVAMLGGLIEFEDGTSAEVQTPGFERMTKGRKYLLFLITNNDGSAVLLPTGGPQGVFEINGNQIKYFGRSTDSIGRQIKDRDFQSLMERVREYAARWPNAVN